MTAEAAVFWVFAIVTVGSFALLFTFFGVAGLYVLLGADFLAATQLLIYVGGILVLLLFGVMLTHKIYDLDLRTETTQLASGLIVAAGLFVILATTGLRTQWMGATSKLVPTTAEIGRLFLSDYLLPFEAASVLLLVALLGAAMIVRRRRDA
jgi:NADH:ubiquinone oxidoreductase subunit 6 (subunit J)